MAGRELIQGVRPDGKFGPIAIDELNNVKVVGANVPAGSTLIQVADGTDNTKKWRIRADGSAEVYTVNQTEAKVSTLNTPTAPLAANASFVGEWEEVINYSAISAVIFTDAASASGGVKVQFSADMISIAREVSTSIPANIGSYFSLAPEARYFRVSYTNGAVAQTILHAQVIYHYTPPAVVEQPLGSQITDLNLAQITRAALAGRHSSGAYFPLATTTTGHLSTRVENLIDSPGLTNAQLRATPVPVDTELSAAGPLATEATLASIAAEDFATQATLELVRAQTAAINANTDAIEALLTTIRDEQFRRTDPLAAGTNLVGYTQDELTELIVAASGTRTATWQTAEQVNLRARGIRFYLNVTAVSGTLPTLDVKLQTKDPISGNWADMASASFPQINSVGTWVLVIYPGITQSTVGSVVRVNNIMSRNYRLASTIGGTVPSFTYSIAGVLLP